MSLGVDRERQVKRLLENEGYWVARAAGSFGDADLVALKRMGTVLNFRSNVVEPARTAALLIEVKATAAGPYTAFGPIDRLELLQAAELAGAEAWLYWWPSRKKLQRIPASEWPPIKLKEAA